MKIHTQTTAGLRELARLIEPMSVAMLTGSDGEGMLASRPMSPLEMDAEGSIWFFTDARSSKTENLGVLSLGFTSDASATYVSIAGHGTLHTDRGSIDRLWSAAARPWFPDGKDSPNLALLAFHPQTAEYWDAPSSKMVRMVAFAASVVAGKPIGLGDHATLTQLTPAAGPR
jgi:general stress protein 26